MARHEPTRTYLRRVPPTHPCPPFDNGLVRKGKATLAAEACAMVGSASAVEMIGLIGLVGGSGTVRAVRAIGAFDVVGTVKSVEAAELLELALTADTAFDPPPRRVASRCFASLRTALPWQPTTCRRAGVCGLAGPLCRMDAAHEPPWMGLRRVPRTHTPHAWPSHKTDIALLALSSYRCTRQSHRPTVGGYPALADGDQNSAATVMNS